MKLYTWKPSTFLMDKWIIKEHVCEKKDKIQHSMFLQNLAAAGQRGSKIVCWQTRKTRLLMPLRKYSHNKLEPQIHLADRWHRDSLIPDGNASHWLFPCQPFSPHLQKCVWQALFPKSRMYHLGSAENICWNSCKQNLNSLYSKLFSLGHSGLSLQLLWQWHLGNNSKY